MLRDTAQYSDSSVLVVVDEARSAEPLLGRSLHQALRRHSSLHVFFVPAFAAADDRRIVDPAAVELGQKELATTLDRLSAGSRATVDACLTRSPVPVVIVPDHATPVAAR